jgi:hypothetical protein
VQWSHVATALTQSAKSGSRSEPFRFTGKLERVIISVRGEALADFAKTIETAWLVQ